MVNSEEIVERTFYISLLHTAIKMGLTLNPDDYLPLSEANQTRFQKDKASLTKFIYVFGIGNNQVRGAKIAPRITIELKGYYPGEVGIPAFNFDKDEDVSDNYQVVSYPWDLKDITIDVHLVADTQADMRLLHNIMYHALPPRGYLTPYFNDYEEWKQKVLGPTGNLFIEVGNYYDKEDTDHGKLEKVYTYICKDGVLTVDSVPDPEDPDKNWEIKPIQDISILISTEDNPSNTTNLRVPNNT